MAIQSFSQFIQQPSLTESSQNLPGSSTLFEWYMVDALNALKEKHDLKREDFKFRSKAIASADHAKYAPQAYDIAMKLRGLSSVFQKNTFESSGQTRVEVSEDYATYVLMATEGTGRIDRTAKCDIQTVDKKYRYSLKNVGAKAPMGQPQTGDLMAVFQFAGERYKGDLRKQIESLRDKVFDMVSPTFDAPPKSLGTYVDMRHASTKKGSALPGWNDAANDNTFMNNNTIPTEVREYLRKIAVIDKQIKSSMVTSLNKELAAAPVFKQYFVFEQLTGAGKFGGHNATIAPTTPLGSANYLLQWSTSDKYSTKVFGIAKPHDEFVVHASKSVRLKIRWRGKIGKEGPGIRTSIEESFDRALREEWTALIQEGAMWDTAKEKIKSSAAAVVAWAKKLLDAIKQFIAKFTERLIDALDEGFHALADVLGIEGVDVDGPAWLF